MTEKCSQNDKPYFLNLTEIHDTNNFPPPKKKMLVYIATLVPCCVLGLFTFYKIKLIAPVKVARLVGF